MAFVASPLFFLSNSAFNTWIRASTSWRLFWSDGSSTASPRRSLFSGTFGGGMETSRLAGGGVEVATPGGGGFPTSSDFGGCPPTTASSEAAGLTSGFAMVGSTSGFTSGCGCKGSSGCEGGISSSSSPASPTSESGEVGEPGSDPPAPSAAPPPSASRHLSMATRHPTTVRFPSMRRHSRWLSMATRQLTARRRSRRLSIATCSLSTASGRGLSIGRANAITIGCGSSRRRALGSSRRRGALIIGPNTSARQHRRRWAQGPDSQAVQQRKTECLLGRWDKVTDAP